MKDEKNIFIMIAAIPAFAGLILFIISKLTFDLSLSPLERKLFNFNYENIPKISETVSMPMVNLRNPFNISKSSSHTAYPDVPLTALSHPVDSENKRVSLILINEKNKIAIIDGKLLKIGDALSDQRVLRIEKNRVLLKNKEGEKWLLLE